MKKIVVWYSLQNISELYFYLVKDSLENTKELKFVRLTFQLIFSYVLERSMCVNFDEGYLIFQILIFQIQADISRVKIIFEQNN